LPRRPKTGRPTLLAFGAFVAFFSVLMLMSAPARATAGRSVRPGATALGGFVKDRAMARLLGEMLFRDTVDVMSDPAVSPAAIKPDPSHDNSAVGQVARTVLASRKLDKYLWLIRQAYSDTLWTGGDRARIEQHFPLIWRTSIMLYEATLNASPHRVRVCSPADDGESFDCRDEIERAKVIPIPSQAPLIGLSREPVIG
jgi:hypothetical protein